MANNLLKQWVHDISIRDNKSALLFVMFNNSEYCRGAIYSCLIQNGNELMAQFSIERKVKAYCHLIKRAYNREQLDKAFLHASKLNVELKCYAESLMAIANKSAFNSQQH